MDPISSSNVVAPISTTERIQPPTPPDASDVQHFQDIYSQDNTHGPNGAGNVAPNDGAWQTLQFPIEVTQVPDSLFHTAMERLMETHERGSIAVESLLEHMDSGANISPAELLKVQIALGEATTGLSTFQTFDKKSDEGLKTLLTGQ